MPKPKLTAEQKKEVLRRWRNGETQVSLAIAFGVDQTTVSHHLRRMTKESTAQEWGVHGGRNFLRRPEAVAPRFIPPKNPPKLRHPHEVTAGEARRFWELVRAKNENGCRLWNGYRQSAFGYGYFTAEGQTHLAHRVAWRLSFGPIPDGKQVNHSCDVRPCVSPDHLWVGTGSENMRDMVAKGRHRDRRGIPKAASITWAEVREIRALRGSGWTVEAMATRFRISKAQVSNIINHRQWKEAAPSEDVPEISTAGGQQELLRRWSAGATQVELAVVFGISEKAVVKYLREITKTPAARGENGARYAMQRPGKPHQKVVTARGSHSPRGESSPHTSLTWEKVRAMRRERFTGGFTVTALAEKYGISIGQVSNICSGKQWKEDPEN